MSTLDPVTREAYRAVLQIMAEAGPPFLVGGAYALECHTAIARHTKDLDLFVAPGDCDALLELFQARGYEAGRTHPHWLAKVEINGACVDVIYRSGNGLAEVDREWIARGVPGTVVDLPVRLLAAEEMIWTKAFVMERERFDGADVAHLLRARGADLDGERLLRLFGPHWQVLYAHLILFGYIYPAEAARMIPRALRDELARRLAADDAAADPTTRVCQGTLLSRSQYLIDIDRWGYLDARLAPRGRMTSDDVAAWTEAIARDGSW
jgi:hypothetical protein